METPGSIIWSRSDRSSWRDRSLVFVGYQIKDGNQEARAATIQAASDSEMFVQSQFLRYADTWAKIVAGSPLSEGRETQKGLTLFNMLMTLNENRFHQTKSGFLDQYLINIDITLDFPFYEIWRDSKGANTHTPDFLNLIDRRKRELDSRQ